MIMSEFIDIKQENFKQYLPLDIAAFHYSEPGACGSPGILRIITSKKELYRVDYFYDEWEESDLYQVCPVLRSIRMGMFGHHLVPSDWRSVYMGLGNSLFITNEIAAKLDFTGLKRGEIYQQWVDKVLEVI